MKPVEYIDHILDEFMAMDITMARLKSITAQDFAKRVEERQLPILVQNVGNDEDTIYFRKDDATT